MKKLGMIGAVLAGVLLLAACGEAEQATNDAAESSANRRTAEQAEAPLAAETPVAPESPDASDADASFLEYVRANLQPETQIPDATDQQLLEAGQVACARLAAGESMDGMVVVEDEQPWENGYYYDSSAIINGAVQFVCPDDY